MRCQKSNPATPETSKIESGDSIYHKNQVRRPRRLQNSSPANAETSKSSLASPETSKIKSNFSGNHKNRIRRPWKHQKNRVWRHGRLQISRSASLETSKAESGDSRDLKSCPATPEIYKIESGDRRDFENQVLRLWELQRSSSAIPESLKVMPATRNVSRNARRFFKR